MGLRMSETTEIILQRFVGCLPCIWWILQNGWHFKINRCHH